MGPWKTPTAYRDAWRSPGELEEPWREYNKHGEIVLIDCSLFLIG